MQDKSQVKSPLQDKSQVSFLLKDSSAEKPPA